MSTRKRRSRPQEEPEVVDVEVRNVHVSLSLQERTKLPLDLPMGLCIPLRAECVVFFLCPGSLSTLGARYGKLGAEGVILSLA